MNDKLTEICGKGRIFLKISWENSIINASDTLWIVIAAEHSYIGCSMQ